MTDQHHNHNHNHSLHDTGLHHLPFRVRESHHRSNESFTASKQLSVTRTNAPAKRVPESLHFTPSTFRLRSPTESSMSSISSANVPDSATTHSLSTLASPISTSYASSDIQELFAAHGLNDSRPTSRVCHRHQPSNGTCSTFVNDEDDAIFTGYPELDLKIQHLHEERQRSEVHEEIINEPVPISPATESPVKEEEIVTPIHSPRLPEVTSGGDGNVSKWDTDSEDSDDVTEEDAELVTSYVLQLVYGMDAKEASIPQPVSHKLVQNFVRDLEQHIWQAPSDTQLSHTMSTSSSSSTPSQGGSGGSGSNGRGGKRKKQGRRDDDGEELSDGEGSGYLPTKRARPNPKEDENLRLSCPFRKRNPHRFNVRDHHSCAMTYFPKFAELRQHIVKQHKRDDPSAFVCDRCTRDFASRKELRDHQRLPKELMCDIADHDAENGIDGPTATKLLSRKRASGASTEIQWREIWNILFPDDDDHEVKPFEFTPVIEHFELSTNYLVSFEQLQISLRDKISNPATLETLATKFHQCFIETLERCISEAQSMPYTNRSNKKNEIARNSTIQNPILRKSRDILPRPDSGVVMDDGSEESGSVMGTGLGHRESVRTVRGATRRGSSLVPETVREVIPARTTPSAFDETMARQPSMTPLAMNGSVSMDPAAVQAWNNSVLYSQIGDMGLQNQLLPTGTMTPQPEYMNWGGPLYQTNFDDMNNGFSGFNGQ